MSLHLVLLLYILSDFINGNGSSKQHLDKSPGHEFHTGEAMEKCGDVFKDLSCSTVIASLPLAIKCLRDYVKENPTLSLQVSPAHVIYNV